MTDKEIIKALDFCSDDEAAYDLYPYHPHKPQIVDLCIAFDERIQRIKELESEIKQLKERLDAKCDICIERERTAAIGEFAWRLKLLLTPYPDCDFKEPVTSKQIDTLVKEMTEDTDNA